MDMEEFREEIRRRNESAKHAIVKYIDEHGKAFAGNLLECVGGMSLCYVRKFLIQLEQDEVLESWLEESSRPRRYYRRRRRNEDGAKKGNGISTEEHQPADDTGVSS